MNKVAILLGGSLRADDDGFHIDFHDVLMSADRYMRQAQDDVQRQVAEAKPLLTAMQELIDIMDRLKVPQERRPKICPKIEKPQAFWVETWVWRG